MANNKLPEHRIFNNAPIKEAIIDISFPEIPESSLSLIESLEFDLSNYFPNKKTMRRMSQTFGFDKGQPSNSSSEFSTIGYQFWAQDEVEDLVTCRRDGFSYNKLKPYTEWNKVLDKTLIGWGKYKNKINPTVINKLSVRNINLIEIPEIRFELDDYFLITPNLPPEINHNMEDFLIQFIIDFSDKNAKCLVTMATHPPTKDGHVSV
ncbi:MAG: TIGR04255 family protein, partial [Rickettsiales bacterium]